LRIATAGNGTRMLTAGLRPEMAERGARTNTQPHPSVVGGAKSAGHASQWVGATCES